MQSLTTAIERTEALPIRFRRLHHAQLQVLSRKTPDNESGFPWPDARPVESGLERAQQFGFALQGGRFIGTELKLDPGHLAHHPEVPARHPVGIGYAVMVEPLLQVLCFANVEYLVAGVLHQVHAGSSGCSPEKLPAQPLIERLRIRNQEQLAHAANGLVQNGAERQSNQCKSICRPVSAHARTHV